MNNCSVYNNEIFKDNLEYLTKKKGLTKKVLEDEIGVGDGYLSRLIKEGSTQEPSVHLMALLAEKLGVTIDELMHTEIKVKEENTLSNKTIKFLNKLVEETKNFIRSWGEFRLACEWNNQRTVETDLYKYENSLEEICYFVSRYGREYGYIGNKRSVGYITKINDNLDVIFLKLICPNEEEYYELYFNKDEKGYEICSSGLGDEITDSLLEELWQGINLDWSNYILGNLMDEYLNKNRVSTLEHDEEELF